MTSPRKSEKERRVTERKRERAARKREREKGKRGEKAKAQRKRVNERIALHHIGVKKAL